MFKGKFTKKVTIFLCVLSFLPFLNACKNNFEISSASSSFDSQINETVSPSTKPDSSLSERKDGDTIVYSYSVSHFSEFRDFVSDFLTLNPCSFVSFNLDEYDNITSEFTFEGYPCPSNMKRSDVCSTKFEYFTFSCSFSDERRTTIGVDESRFLEVTQPIFINPTDFHPDSISYNNRKRDENSWEISFYSGFVLISSLILSFNGKSAQENVDDYCEIFAKQIFLFQKVDEK